MKCPRCKNDTDFEFPDGKGDQCEHCGIAKGRRVLSRNALRRRSIGGKRGRNSGKVGTAKNK